MCTLRADVRGAFRARGGAPIVWPAQGHPFDHAARGMLPDIAMRVNPLLLVLPLLAQADSVLNRLRTSIGKPRCRVCK